MNRHTDSSKNDVLMKHLTVLSNCYATACFEDLFPLLAEDTVWESQWLLEPRTGKQTVIDYYEKKGKSIRESNSFPHCDIIQFVGNMNRIDGANLHVNGEEKKGASVGLFYPEDKYALLMSQELNGETNYVVLDLTLDENDLIARIDLCMPELFKFKVLSQKETADNTEDMSLKAALLKWREDPGKDAENAFLLTFKKFADQGGQVNIPCKQDEDDLSFKIYEIRGKNFAAMYSDSSEIRNSDKDDIVLIDINTLIEYTIKNKVVHGIIIDPETTGLCLENGYMLQCLLHCAYPKQDNGGKGEKDWGTGIPEYTPEDLMTEGEVQNFAMHTVLESEEKLKNNCNLISACDYPGAMPSIACAVNGQLMFILVKGHTTRQEPELTDKEREELLSLGRKYNADCYWCPVGFLAADLVRFNAELALRGDAYYCKYEGLRPVE